MMGKIVIGKSFGGCIRYVTEKEGAQVLYADGIRMENNKQMIHDFNMQRKLSPSLGQAVGHISLNWSEEDKGKLSPEKMVEMAMEYLAKMKIKDTQVLIVQHHDANHPHIHIVYNRVDNQGKTIPDNYQQWKNVKVCKDMTIKHGLYMAKSKQRVNMQALKGADKMKYQLFDQIKKECLTTRSWKQFENRLKKQDIGIVFKYKSGTKEIQGVSFSKGEYTFKGSEIDRSLSFGKLDKLFDLNMDLYQREQQQNHQQLQQWDQEPSLAEQLRQSMSSSSHQDSFLDILLRSESPIAAEIPDPLKKKRKKSQGMGMSR